MLETQPKPVESKKEKSNQDPATRRAVPEMVVARSVEELPAWADRDTLAHMLHHKMVPFNDKLEDVYRGLDYALTQAPGTGGFVVVARLEGELVGAVVMLKTGMKGYIPENLLLFVVVDPSLRGKGIGRVVIERALSECDGDVKLHVEADNPAARLYERIGFERKYVEMRWASR